jgi:hypothetical protein
VIFSGGCKDSEEIPEMLRHFSVVSDIAQYFPEVVADIRKNEGKAREFYLKQRLLLKDILPYTNIEMYRRYYEMTLSPIKSKGYTKLTLDVKKDVEICADVKLVEQVR